MDHVREDTNTAKRALLSALWYFDLACYLAALGVVLWMFVAHVTSVLEYPYFTPSSNVEELGYTYISSANFNKFGFLFTGFLQDFAASPDISDHPYVYSHMPPGPDVANALLMRISGGSFTATAIVLASLVVPGFAFYFLFVRRVLSSQNLFGGLFVLLLTPWVFYLPHFTNPIWNGFLLLTFVPLVTTQWAYDRVARWLFFSVTLPFILLSSLYLDYIVLSSVIACWVLLYLTQLLRVDGRDFIFVGATFACGIFLNVLKNFLYFGPRVFFQELAYVLSNRITGYPSQKDLAEFYREHAIVHHGAHPPTLMALIDRIELNLEFTGLMALLAGVAISLLISLRLKRSLPVADLAPSGISDLKFFVRLSLFVIGTVLTPIFIFPAFAQEVSLYGGTNFVWMGLFAVGAAALATRRVLSPIADLLTTRRVDFPKSVPDIAAFVVAIVAWCGAGWLIVTEGNAAYERLKSVVPFVEYRYASNPHAQFEALRNFGTGVFLTNINVPTVYFYTQRPGFGVCGLNSISEEGAISLDDCKIAFLRDRQRYVNVRPSYFFLFKYAGYFPGFADCFPPDMMAVNAELGIARAPVDCLTSLQSKLKRNFRTAFENDLVAVYDMRAAP